MTIITIMEVATLAITVSGAVLVARQAEAHRSEARRYAHLLGEDDVAAAEPHGIVDRFLDWLVGM